MSLDTFFVWKNSYFKGLSHQKKHLKQLKVPCNKSPIIIVLQDIQQHFENKRRQYHLFDLVDNK